MIKLVSVNTKDIPNEMLGDLMAEMEANQLLPNAMTYSLLAYYFATIGAAEQSIKMITNADIRKLTIEPFAVDALLQCEATYSLENREAIVNSLVVIAPFESVYVAAMSNLVKHNMVTEAMKLNAKWSHIFPLEALTIVRVSGTR